MKSTSRRKAGRLLISAFVVELLTLSLRASPDIQRVEYILDSVAERDEEYVRLLGGSRWILPSSVQVLVSDEVVIVLENGKSSTATAYLPGQEVPVKLVAGTISTESGYLTTVVEQFGKGAVLNLADGSRLSVAEYDRYHTAWWLPPYKALLTANRMYLWNLARVKRVWVEPILPASR